MRQLNLAYQAPIEKQGGAIPYDPPVKDKVEKIRLSRQCQMMLNRLKRGPTTNGELAKMGLRYSARIMELREAGHHIEIIKKDTRTGMRIYELRGWDEQGNSGADR